MLSSWFCGETKYVRNEVRTMKIVKGTLKSALFLHANTYARLVYYTATQNGSGLTIWNCATSQSDHHRQQRILREECAPMQALTARDMGEVDCPEP